jgi:hypothetical protein
VGDIEEEKKISSSREPLGTWSAFAFWCRKDNHKSKRVRPLFNHRPASRSCTTGLSPHTPFLNALIPLGSSSSAVNQPLASLKHTARWILAWSCGFASFHCRWWDFVPFSWHGLSIFTGLHYGAISLFGSKCMIKIAQ